jgi:hypothetical protein
MASRCSFNATGAAAPRGAFVTPWQLISDMGGVDCMSKARRQLCRPFAALTVEMLESRFGQGVEVHVTEYSTISSTPACAEARYRS